MIDDIIKRDLTDNPERVIILFGSGFDTRAYRLKGGHWVELDDPQLIEYKNKCLPVSQCDNSLKRMPYDYGQDSLPLVLSEFKTRKQVIIIIEGVFIYLDADATRNLFKHFSNYSPIIFYYAVFRLHPFLISSI